MLRAAPVVLLFATFALAPLAAGARGPTPDQQLVVALETATDASRAALRSLARPSTRRATKGVESLEHALRAMDAASKVAPRAVAALDNRSMRIALKQGRTLASQAAADIARGRYARARTKIKQALKLKALAMKEFGVPLVKDFPSFAVNRDFRKIPAFKDYSGLTATAGEEVVEIIIGAANRVTAAAGEARTSAGTATGLPIADLSAYQIQDPIGAYISNRCMLEAGLISCRLRPTLRPQYSFTIAFGPKLERGTKILVKFRSASGRRSYSVFTTR